MDNYVLKLTGKAELPSPLKIGHNIKTTLQGSIVSETISDNEDGTNTHYFSFRPIIVEVLNETGERIKAKDVRRLSQQLRSLLWKRWQESNEPTEFEDYYNKRMLEIMSVI
jgi:hypothetical protein